jgi:hypothetical protein
MVLSASVKRLIASIALALLPSVVCAQHNPTATQDLEISAFGGVTGTYTGILGGRNLSITAGGDLAFKSFFGLRPAIEVRGTLPLDNGSIGGERNVLGGVTLSKRFGRFNVYGDFLYGRGEIKFQNGGLENAAGTEVFLTANSNILSPGGGFEYDISRHFSIKGDAQFQRYATPFSQQAAPPATPPGPITVFVPSVLVPLPGTLSDTAGHATAKAFTLGVKYRFNFNKHGARGLQP